MRWLNASPVVSTLLLTLGLASSGHAATAMFDASFIIHGWGNDISTGTPYGPTQYTANDWTAAPLGSDCQHADPYTPNGAARTRYCAPTIRHEGHPATGMWTASIPTHMTATPPAITLQQSQFGVSGVTGFRPTFVPYLQSFTYATFVNAAGTFFAGGGAAAGAGYNNKGTGRPGGTWRIRAGKNAFGGALGLLGKYGVVGRRDFRDFGFGTLFSGTSSGPFVKAFGRPYKNTQIGTGTMGTPLYQNPYTKTDKWYRVTPMGMTLTYTFTAVGTGTLWTTGQVGNFAKTGAYFTILYRTGYDNRNASGIGNIQLVTPTRSHWLFPSVFGAHSAQIGILTIQVVPEPGAVLLLAAGAGALVGLYRVSRWGRGGL